MTITRDSYLGINTNEPKRVELDGNMTFTNDNKFVGFNVYYLVDGNENDVGDVLKQMVVKSVCLVSDNNTVIVEI